MDLQVLYEGIDVTNKVISYKYEQQICTGIGNINITFDNTFTIGRPWDTIILYENSIKQATYNVIGSVENHDGNINVSAQDNSKKLTDYFIVDSYETGETLYYAKTWIVKFLNEVDLSYHFTVSGSGSPLSNNTSLGLMSAYDQIQQLLQQSGWYMYFDADGRVIIGKRGISHSKQTFDETNILNIQTSKNDSKLRNRAVVWGNSNVLTDSQVFADISTKTPWNYDNTDKRAIVYANSNIYSTADANRIAHKLLNEFSKIDYVKYVDVAGAYNLVVGNVVHIDSDYFSGNGVVTSIEVSMSSKGHITKLTLDERCPRLFAFYSPEQTYPEYDDNHVYVGTYGSGIWRKTILGSDWEDVSTGLANLYITDLFINNGNYVCVAGDDYAYIKTYMTNWTKFSPSGFIADTTTYLLTDVKAIACTINSITNDMYILYKHKSLSYSWVVKAVSSTIYTVTLLETTTSNNYIGYDIDTNDKDLFITTYREPYGIFNPDFGIKDRDAMVSLGYSNPTPTNTMNAAIKSLSELDKVTLESSTYSLTKDKKILIKENYAFLVEWLIDNSTGGPFYSWQLNRYDLTTGIRERTNPFGDVAYKHVTKAFTDIPVYMVVVDIDTVYIIGFGTQKKFYSPYNYMLGFWKYKFSTNTWTLFGHLNTGWISTTGYHNEYDVNTTLVYTGTYLSMFCISSTGDFWDRTLHSIIYVNQILGENECGNLIFNQHVIYENTPHEVITGYDVKPLIMNNKAYYLLSFYDPYMLTTYYKIIVDSITGATTYDLYSVYMSGGAVRDIIFIPYYSENKLYFQLDTLTSGYFDTETNTITYDDTEFDYMSSDYYLLCNSSKSCYFKFSTNELFDLSTKIKIFTTPEIEGYGVLSPISFADDGNIIYFTCHNDVSDYGAIVSFSLDDDIPEVLEIFDLDIADTPVQYECNGFILSDNYTVYIDLIDISSSNSVLKGDIDLGFVKTLDLPGLYKVECSKEYPVTVYPITSSGDLIYVSPFGEIDTFDTITITSGNYVTDCRIFDVVSGTGYGRFLSYVLVSGTGGGIIPILIPDYDVYESLTTTLSGYITTLETNNMGYDYSPYFFVGISGVIPRFFQRNSDIGVFFEASTGLPSSNITVIRIDDRL